MWDEGRKGGKEKEKEVEIYYLDRLQGKFN